MGEMRKRTMNYKDAFHKAYLNNKGLKDTEKNRKEHSVKDKMLRLGKETEENYIVICGHANSKAITFIDKVDKQGQNKKILQTI